jgi:branched-chain amino acid transport system substrate-binding protein
VGLIAGLVAVAAACSDDDDGTPVTTTTVPVATTVPRTSDGVLTLGVLLPQSGPGATFGVPLTEAVRRAVQIVNENGGVLGLPIDLVVADEGVDASAASGGLDELIEQGQVDAVVGPASSRVALTVLNRSVSSGVLACSPVATAISLSDFPDRGLFFRTIPSDALQAEAIARVVDQTGLGSAAVTYPDDVFGRTFAEAVRSSLTTLGITIAADVPYDPLVEDQAAQVGQAFADRPPVVVVIGDSNAGVKMLTQLVDGEPAPGPVYVVSDALRRPDQPTLLDTLSPSQLNRVKGVSPEVLPQSTALLEQLGLEVGDPAGAFASQGFDCVNLIALAATQAGSDDPTVIAGQLLAISRGGSSCRDFPTCVQLLNEGRNVDYNGYEGLVRLGSNGDPTVGRFERFGFDADGLDVVEQRFEVGDPG